MSLLANVYSMFRTQPPAQPPVQMTNNPAQNPAPAQAPENNQATGPNGVIPKGAGDGPSVPELQKYENLFEPQKPDENAGSQNPGFDPQAIMQAAAKVDFRKAIPQEALTKIAAGGDDAVAAFADAMNAIAQQSYAQSAVTAAKLVEHAVQQAQQTAMQGIPEVLRRQQTEQALMETNPQLSHPAVKPVLDLLSTQLMQKFPKASPKELQTMSLELLQGAANLANPQKTAASEKTGRGEDWESYLTK